MKRTKIVATIGPASEKQATLEKMMRAGMNVCRLNMSHGDYAWHGKAIRTIRAAAKKVGEPVAVLLDLQGPKVRLGEVHSSQFTVHSGDRVVFTTGVVTGNKILIAVPHFEKYAKKGSHLLIADGTIECIVEDVRGRDIHARVTLGGELKSHKGIAIAGVSLPLPSLTAKDKKDAAWGRTQDIDFVALSFVKQAADVVALRKLLTPSAPTPPNLPSGRGGKIVSPPLGGGVRGGALKIIVKIETREAVNNFDEILKVVDAVMIARGDLALATSPEEVPIIQKELIEKCRGAGKPVIVATEMLASMEHSPRPTRAEASDVANAVVDHTDATMLSGETASGQFPVETVATMAHIIEKTEESRFDDVAIGADMMHGTSEEETALAASVLARNSGAKAIVAGSLTGRTGRLLSRYRTEVLLIVGSPDLRVVHQLNLSWGVRPFLAPQVKTMDALLKLLLQHAQKFGLKKGSKIVVVGSETITPHGQSFIEIKTI